MSTQFNFAVFDSANSADFDDENEMKINLSHPNSYPYRASLSSAPTQPLSPSNQPLNIPTSDPVIYRGTAVDIESFRAPPSNFSVSWDGENDFGEIDEESEIYPVSKKELKLNSLMSNDSFKFDSSKIDLPEIQIIPTQTKFVRELSSPPPLNQIDLPFTFTSYISSTILLNGLCQLLESDKLISPPFQSLSFRVHDRYSSIESRLIHHHGYVGFSLNLFHHPLLPSSIIVEVQKRCGDYKIFVDFYQRLIQNVQKCGWFADYFDANHQINFNTNKVFDTIPMKMAEFEDFDEADLDEQVMREFVRPSAQANNNYRTVKQNREIFDLALELSESEKLPEADSINFIQQGLKSFDAQQNIQSLDLIQILMKNQQVSPKVFALVPILVAAIETVKISTSLQSLFYMRELTRVLLMLVSMINQTQAKQMEIYEKLSFQSRQWSPIDSMIATRFGSIIQKISVVQQN